MSEGEDQNPNKNQLSREEIRDRRLDRLRRALGHANALHNEPKPVVRPPSEADSQGTQSPIPRNDPPAGIDPSPPSFEPPSSEPPRRVEAIEELARWQADAEAESQMAPQDGPQDSPLADPSPMPPTGFAPDPNPSDPAEPGQGKTGRLPPPPTLTEDDVAELGLPKNALNILAHRTKANRAVETGQSPMGPTDTPLRLGEEARLAPGQENPPERQSPLRLTPSESAPVTAAGLELPQPLSPSDDGLSQSPKTDPQGIVARDEAPKWTSPSHRPEPPLLYLDNIYTDIGRYKILRGVNLSIPKGSVTMLLGRNGAGKTTTLRTIMGLWQARDGAIRFNGDEITGMKTPEIARAGIGYVPEDMGIFGDLTVEQNMILAARKGRIPKDHLDWLFGRFPPLLTFWNQAAGTLSGGQKQMLSIARAMAEPRELYLIDEPTKGLAPAIVGTLVDALRQLKQGGATILMVEQNFSVAKALGDHCAVMDDGRIAWSGAMDDLARDTGLQSQLMGLSLEGGAL